MKQIGYISVLLILSALQPVSGQLKVQYGFSIDARLGLVFRYNYLTNFRLSASAGAGAVTKNAMPFVQYTLATFQGGIGSSISVSERRRLVLESRVAFGCVVGAQRSNAFLDDRGTDTLHFVKQVYTMGFMNTTPLKNPYTNYYLSLATNFIFRPNRVDVGNFGQAVGSVSAGGRHWDFHYYNDGPPFDIMALGDGKDRYYTGGGFINFALKNGYDYKTDRQNAFRRIVLGFDRFTGFFPHAYELANILGLKRVPYKDEKQSFYNKGRLYLGVELASMPGLMPMITRNDKDEWDIQNIIHDIGGYPWHTTLHKPSWGVDVYYHFQDKIGRGNY